VAVLHVLASELQPARHAPDAATASTSPPGSPQGLRTSLEAAAQLLREACADAAAAAGSVAVVQAHALEALLAVLRACAEHSPAAAGSGSGSGSGSDSDGDGGTDDPVLVLQQAGLVGQLLAMLCALGPPPHPRRPAPDPQAS